jgi:hypothetical protein
MAKPRGTRQVFISWSGKRSLAVAESLCVFIPEVIPELRDRLFVSTGIEKGSRWSDEIARHLEEADAGILVVTAEGSSSPWLHFEAGALTKGLDSSRARRGERSDANTSSRIFTYLHCLAPSAFTGPLSQYQWTSATRDDTWRLMNALHDLFARGRAELRQARHRFDERWAEFERELRRNAVLVSDVIPDFEGWFQRKTFMESLAECTDKNWIARYDGARDTHGLLGRQAEHVRGGCAQYQWQLYQQLIAVADAYVMGLRPLLRVLPDDETAIATPVIPPEIATECELQRARANTIVQLILHPVAIPLAEDAVAFSVTDSVEERRILAQQYADTVRELADRRVTMEFHGAPHGDVSTGEHLITGNPRLDAVLSTPEGTRKLFRSLWALDRIVGYLAWEHLYAGTVGASDLLLQRASSEIETLAAQVIDSNPLPLQYSLQALLSALCAAQPHHAHDAPAIQRLCTRVEQVIDASRTSDGEPMLDRGKHLRDTLAELRRTLETLPANTLPIPSHTASLVPDPLEDA